MHRRQPLPRFWLMTDERQGDGLWRAIERLPRGAGIVFRHHSLPTAERRALFEAVKRRTRRRDFLLLLAGPPELARVWGADGSHGRGRGNGLRSAPAHSLREIRAAERAGADLVFLSPLFPTRTHPGGRALGRLRFAELARRTRLPVIALGGVDGSKAAGLRTLGAYGWAGIDAWG
jgi:thiamine-phosphate pyrophosphorylase